MNINDYIKEYELYDGIKALVDVREIDEFNEFHIEGAINIPLSNLSLINNVVENKNTKLYVYCRSGYRSAKATNSFILMGYKNAINIGGIIEYKL